MAFAELQKVNKAIGTSLMAYMETVCQDCICDLMTVLSCTKEHRKCSFHIVGTLFQAPFSPEERALLGGP